jgi:hypothetical protein
VLGAVGSDLMEMPLARGVPGVDDKDHEEDNTPSILRGIQCRCGIVSVGGCPR